MEEDEKNQVLGKRRKREDEESIEIVDLKSMCPPSLELMGNNKITRECKRQKIKDFKIDQVLSSKRSSSVNDKENKTSNLA